MRKIPHLSLFVIILFTITGLTFVFRWIDVSSPTVSRLNDHSLPINSSTTYRQVVLLSCSSYALTSVYCYYMPFVALAWRRLGFEPILLLVGSRQIFEQMPLWSLINQNLFIEHHIIEVDNSRAIATSQIARLFGSYLVSDNSKTRSSDDLFIILADVDLLPITRHRFELRNRTARILAVNAYCCPSEKFSFGNLTQINYYPISYVGMNKRYWQEILSPPEHCHISSNFTVEMIECYLMHQMNTTIPRKVIKGDKYWDVDQKLLSILITRAERNSNIQVEKKKLGYRLDPHPNFLSHELDSILSYDDVHLANSQEKHVFNNRTWSILASAFSRLFQNETVELFARYHYQTAAAVAATMPHENS